MNKSKVKRRLLLLKYVSVDTVKTRLQGQPLNRTTVKYTNMVQSYKLILKEEGVLRGLYSGITPAMLGSGKSLVYIYI